MSSMSSLFRRGGPLQGPRLLIACFAVIFVFYYLSQPYKPASSGSGISTSHDAQQNGVGGQVPSTSPGEMLAGAAQEKDDKESLSDKFLEYLKGHNSYGHKSHSPIPHMDGAQTPISATANATRADPFCAHLPDTSDILIVVRTPASDIYTHLPAHFFTTLRCAPFLLYSTVSQNIGPHAVHDALANISDIRRAKHKDFELYDKLQEAQNAVQDMATLKEDNDHNLDKWAIIPHIISAFKTQPHKKWYIFIESDTYVSLPNTLRWLEKLDPTKPLYAGAQVMIGDTQFAHSGSGIILSHAAVRQLVEVSKTRMEEWENMVGNSCCGDKILAEALNEVNVTLHHSFPMIQGETPFSLDWSTRHWCRSAMTWHRMTPATLDMLWQFEQEWVKKHLSGSESAKIASIPPMLFKDYFQTFLIPLIRASQNRSDWDNLSDSYTYTDESRAQYAHYSIEACRAACDLRDTCIQYAWEPNKCRLGNVVRLGVSVPSDKRMKSGWLIQRVEKFGALVGDCRPEEAWVIPGTETRAQEQEKMEAERKEEERRKEEDQKELEKQQQQQQQQQQQEQQQQQQQQQQQELEKQQQQDQQQKQQQGQQQQQEQQQQQQ